MSDVRKEDFYHEQWSGLEIGYTGGLVELNQRECGQPETGTWSLADEIAWAVWAEKENWKIIREVMQTPSFWDLGLIGVDEDDILDLEL